MGANAKTSGKWASRETWKCVLCNPKQRTRIPFYAATGWAARMSAAQYWKANKLSDQDYEILEPVEVFKKGIPYDESVSISY